MRVMALMRAGARVVEATERELPVALPGEVLVRVRACGVCRTDLHIVDGDLPPKQMPIVPGHEIVGLIDVLGDGVTHLAVGDRVGIPWLGYVCGERDYCKGGRETLCPHARFARSLGCAWAGASTEQPAAPLDAAIIFAPVGRLVPEALSRVVAGGVVVCAGIHMSDIPSFPYSHLWEERMIRSVANLTRADAR